SGTTSWTKRLTLNQGPNKIVARAIDVSGKTSESTVIVTLQNTGEWWMLGHDPSHTGAYNEVVGAPLGLLWKYTTTKELLYSLKGDDDSSSPVVTHSEGVVYVGSE